MLIGDRIKEARLAPGYTAEQVAAFLNVSPATVYRYENGDISKLPSKFIKPLADFLCVTPSYLMGWTDEKPVQPKPENNDDEIRILIPGISKLSAEQLERAKNAFRAMFLATYPELNEGEKDK
jgi:transcriptional regulator with XRE-family HTH domain